MAYLNGTHSRRIYDGNRCYEASAGASSVVERGVHITHFINTLARVYFPSELRRRMWIMMGSASPLRNEKGEGLDASAVALLLLASFFAFYKLGG